jgi:beta-N-acetylhexosaminidase
MDATLERMRRLPAALLLVAVALAGCAPTPVASPTRTVTVTPTPTPTPTVDPIAALTLQQEVGQLFVVGTPADSLDPGTLAAIQERHVGGIFLGGRSTAGVGANAAVAAAAQQADADGIPLIVSTDQEGGEVQVLQGIGFDAIPSAVAQGGIAPDQLRTQARIWGGELKQAGVNLDLAPVADVVPAGTEGDNPPVGQLDRQYGSDADAVEAHAAAFAAGLRDAGVLSAAKHFPGLGHVTENTDTHAGVTDTTITPTSPDVTLYGQLARSGVDVVMLSTAIYANIDGTQPGAFSPAVVQLLRGPVGFRGLTITDDLSEAVQVQDVAPGDRAIRAIQAGVDLVLSSHAPETADQMVDAVLDRAQSDPAFRAQVDAAARRVLAWKTTHLVAG